MRSSPNALFHASWHHAWTGLQLGTTSPADGQAIRDQLLTRYEEGHRKYHTLQHLGECLALLQEVESLAVHPAEVAMALWFHDAIYDIPGKANEERSADWAFEALTAAGAETSVAERVRQLVLVTKHDALPVGVDQQLLVDIDLAILGAEEQRFQEYEQQIRQEYSYVPGFLFKRKRREILNTFLDRPVLFSTSPLKGRLEARARENLRVAIGAR